MSEAEAVERDRRGTWWQRFLIWTFSIALALLFYWLLGFVLQDIGRLPGPDWSEFESKRLDPALRTSRDQLANELAEIKRGIENQERRQRLLRDSTASSQKTLSQLLELQRMSLEQKAALPEDQQKALAESQQLFLDNQKKDQQFNESLATQYERQTSLTDEQRKNEEKLNLAEEPLRAEFMQLEREHRLRVAAIKIGVLTPLIILGGWLFARYRNRAYAPIVYAFGVAVLAKTFLVMHEYFPSEYFRYILILSAIAVIGRILWRLLSIVARPGREARSKQYRESYEGFMCPICQYPIRRGPLKFMSWTPRSLRRASKPLVGASDEPYTCPSCTTPLYVKCPNCSATRHSLLPACEHCGAGKDI